jgi:hypothetical protein
MNLIGFKREPGRDFYLRLQGSCRLLSHSSATLQPQVPKATGQGIPIRASVPYKHLLLYCKHYAKERRRLAMALHKPRLILPLLFNTTKGSAALLGFLLETKIATARRLVAAGAL